MINIESYCSSYFQTADPKIAEAMIPQLAGKVGQVIRQFRELMNQPNDNENKKVQYFDRFDRFKRVLASANQKGNRFTKSLKIYYTDRIFIRTIEKYEETSLMFSFCSSGKIDLVQILFHQYHVPLDLVQDSYSLLHHAVEHPKLVHWLVQNQAPIDLRESGGRTPLHFACELGSKITMNILLAGGADVNAQDNDGYTPLHLACSHNEHKSDPRLRAELAILLLAWGANPSLSNKKNKKPKDYLTKINLKNNIFTNDKLPIPDLPRDISLPSDIWISIFGHLPINELINHFMRLPVCKSFSNFAKASLVIRYLKA